MKLLAKLKLNGYFENKRVLKSLLLALGAMSIVFGGCALACFFYIRSYENRIYPNIVVAGMEIGGLTQKEATDLLQAQYNGMLEEGISIASPLGEDGLTAVENIDLRLIGATDPDLVRDIIVFNPDMLALQAYQIGRTEHPAINTIKAMLQLVYKRELDSSITMDSETLESEIKNVFESYEQPGSYTDYVVNFARNEINVDAVQGSIGLVLDTTSAIEEITQDMQDFYIETIQLKLVQTQNPVSEQEASTLVDEVKNIITNAPYTLEFTSEDLKEYSWDIEKEQIADWILPWKNDDGNIELIVEEDKIESFFGEIHSDIDENPTNARFIIEDGKVVEFAGSLDGIELDETKTMEKILQEIHQQTLEPIKIVVSVVEPSITTGSVNNFGIKEILGVGTSDFSGSPYNRIQNIKHGASKLNGLLIAPGETISLVEHLRPFTTADGYLPELVIKGDEIKAEIGGGLCQIGTTAFRAVMNSGLEVTERRNHSLVVSYYDDSTNGNPGTDATIYDPAPDFKFTNTYENYILLTTEVNESNRIIYFTFWGSKDGRLGYYNPPTVLSWSGYGAAQYIETEDLAPGVTKCQSPHPGATTSFDYYIEWPDGSLSEQNFTSVYRSLPTICLVGVDSSGGGGSGTETEEELDIEDVVTEGVE